MATIKDVADKANVSIATVSNVLHGKVTVNPAIVSRVHEAIRELNYHPSMLASNLRVAKTMFIGIVIPSLDPIYSQVMDGILKAFENRDVHLVVKKTGDFRNVEPRVIRQLVNMGAKGIILVTCNASDMDAFRSAQRAGVQLLFLIRRAGEGEFSTILFDNHASIRRVTAEVLEREPGAELLLLTGPTEFSSERDCLEGFNEACEAFGVNPVAIKTPINKQQAFSEVLQYLRSCRRKPSHFIVSGQMLASTLREVALLLGLEKCPIYSLDGDDWYQLHDESSDVRIHRPALMCGELAAEQMQRMIRNADEPPCHIVLPTAAYRQEARPRVEKPRPIRLLLVSGLTADSIVSLLPDFTSTTGIEVRYDVCENHFALYDKILEGQRRPELAPDVMMMDYLWEREFVLKGCLKDIRGRIDADNDGFLEHFLPTIRHTFIEGNGAVHALPAAIGSQMLLYRKDLFDDAALQRKFFARTGTELREPATWSEFNTIARFFTRAFEPDSPVRYGTCLMGYNPHGLVEEFLPRLWASNGVLCSKGELQINTEKSRRALANLCESLQYSYPNIGNYMETQQMSEFAKGDIAMINTFSLHIPSIYNIQQEWLVTSLGMCMLPGKKPMLGEWMLGISDASERAEESFAFLKWATGNRLCIHSTALGGFMPKAKVMDNCELDSIYPWKKNIDAYLSACRDVETVSFGRNTPLPVNDVYTILGNGIASAIYGYCSVEQALGRMEEQFLRRA